MKKNEVTLSPSYITRFHCIGEKCEDNCCYGWRVSINEKIYKKYKKVVQPEFKEKIRKNITRNRSNSSRSNYAKIRMNEKGECPFLDGDKLCGLQKKLGIEYLSKTCMNYPRTFNVVNGIFEKSLTMSCPEAARVALLNSELMEFNELEESIDVEDYEGRFINTEELKYSNKAKRYLWDLRIFTITLLQNRNYSLGERLIILGLFIKNVENLIEKQQVNYISNIISKYDEMIKDETLKDELNNIPTNLSIQMELMKEINDIRIFDGANVNSKAYIECIIEFLKGIQYTKEATIEEISTRYKDAYEKYYNSFMKEHEYILENYLVNHVFKELFPISSKEGVFYDYVNMVIRYSLIKMMLIGMSAYHEQLNEEIVVRLIYSFSRSIEHSKVFLNKVMNLLKENHYNTMAYMAILIKN